MTDERRIASFHRDGLDFDVLDTGPVGGETVVLLHGFPQRAASWAAVAGVLNASGFRTVAPDQRGYSPGARPGPVSAYRGGRLIADVVALIDEIGGPVHLVGHDWGSVIAWGVAIQHADRLRSLTAVSVGHPSAFLRALWTPGQLARSYYMNIFQVRRLAEWLLTKPGAWGEQLLRESGMDDAMYATYRREIVDAGALTGGLNWYRALPLSMNEPRRPVQVPTTLVWSDQDVTLGRRQAERTAGYVHAPYEFVELAGATHWLPDQRPDELAAIIARRVRSVG